MNFVRTLFRRINIDSVQRAISDADSAMSSFARDILSGKANIRKEDIAESQRNVQFNALSDRIQRNIDILTKARDTELKRYRISDNADAKGLFARRSLMLESHSNANADTIEGILFYAR